MISDIGFYLRLLSRRFPAMAALFLLSTCIGIVSALRAPTVYSTSATLLVEAAQVPEEMVRAMTQIETEEQLSVIQQRLMTRANLLQVARDNNVFPNQSAMNPDGIAFAMRNRTWVRRSGGRNRATLMTIGFRGPSPGQVAAVVNQYVTILLEASNELRAGRTEGALEFFEQEVETLSRNLDAKNAEIVEFKTENSNALPESLSFRLSRQALLQERVARAERDIEGLQSQRETIKRIYEATGQLTEDGRAQLTPEQARMRQLRGELNVTLSLYSESYPKVKLLRSQIAQLEEKMRASSISEDGEEDGLSPLDTTLADFDKRAESLRREIARTNEELEKLQESIALTPSNRLRLQSLEREQGNLQGLYAAAINRLSQAQLGERIELSSKGERITVLEPATVPNRPSGPKRGKIMAMGVGVGLALAGGLFVLLELLNQTIRRPIDITRTLNITPLATVPRFETLADQRWRRTVQVATLGVVIIAVPTSLWAVDTYYMPLDIIFEKVINRLT